MHVVDLDGRQILSGVKLFGAMTAAARTILQTLIFFGLIDQRDLVRLGVAQHGRPARLRQQAITNDLSTNQRREFGKSGLHDAEFLSQMSQSMSPTPRTRRSGIGGQWNVAESPARSKVIWGILDGSLRCEVR